MLDPNDIGINFKCIQVYFKSIWLNQKKFIIELYLNLSHKDGQNTIAQTMCWSLLDFVWRVTQVRARSHILPVCESVFCHEVDLQQWLRLKHIYLNSSDSLTNNSFIFCIYFISLKKQSSLWFSAASQLLACQHGGTWNETCYDWWAQLTSERQMWDVWHTNVFHNMKQMIIHVVTAVFAHIIHTHWNVYSYCALSCS